MSRTQRSVTVQQAFGQMKCKWGHLYDLQHTQSDAVVMIIMVRCFFYIIRLLELWTFVETPVAAQKQQVDMFAR